MPGQSDFMNGQPMRWLCACLLLAGLLGDPAAAFAFQARVIHFPAGEEKTPQQDFTILGAVKQPGCYTLAEKQVPLSQLVSLAGGMTQASPPKVRVIRGGRAGIVFLYTMDPNFELKAGDIVRLEKERGTAVRVISYDQALQQRAENRGESAEAQVVRKAYHEQHPAQSERGHVVLLGIKSEPVVMPLWTDGLTTDTLLTKHLRQDPAVASHTTLLSGQYPLGQPGQLTDGMILQLPAHLVNHQSMPAGLPAAINPATPTETSPTAPEVAPRTEESTPLQNSAEISTPAVMIPAQAQPLSVEQAEIPQVPFQVEQLPRLTPDQQARPLTPPPAMRETAAPVQGTELMPVLPTLENSTVPENSVEPPRQPSSTTPTLELTTPQTTNDESQKLTAIPSSQIETGNTDTNTEIVTELKPFEMMLTETMQNYQAEQSQRTTAADAASAQAPAADKAPLPETEPSLDDLFPEQPPAEVSHLALANEMVPAPRDVSAPQPISLVGFIAGGIVLLGVGTVISSALRNRFFTVPVSLKGISEQKPSVPPPASSPEAAELPVTKSPPQNAQKLPEGHRPSPAASNTPVASASTTVSHEKRPTLTPEQSTGNLPENRPTSIKSTSVDLPWEAYLQLPISEERVVLPREMTFFGRPQQHYEFRIDAKHELRKPHHLQAAPRESAESEAVKVAVSNERSAAAKMASAAVETGTVAAGESVLYGPPAPASHQEISSSATVEESTPIPQPHGLFASAYALARKPDVRS